MSGISVIGSQRHDLSGSLVTATRQQTIIDDRLGTRFVEWHIHRLHAGIAVLVTQVDVIEVETAVNDADYDALASISLGQGCSSVHIVNTGEIPDAVAAGQERQCP